MNDPADESMSEQERHESLQGWEPELNSDADLRDAVEKAFEYRGDVTLGMKNGELLVAFLFNREFDVPTPFISVYPAVENSQAKRFDLSEIESLKFTGKDTATGNSWEAWVAKWEAKHGPRS
ncbi:MAG: hypothetical protein ACI97A_003133 [Planctomycetota bacterium]|jgi:hypothetical protein